MIKKLLIAVCLVAIIAALTGASRRRGDLMPKNVASATSPTPDILWWKLNEGSGTSITGDSSNGGDDGSTDADWTTGIAAGSALSFVSANSDDALTSASITYSTNRLTFSFWLNANPQVGMILESSANLNSNDNCFYCYKSGAATVQFSVKNGGTRAETFTIATNQNLHVVAAWDGSTTAGDWVVWTNGVECTVTSVDITSRASTAGLDPYVLYVGARGGSSVFYNRPFDDFRIYSGTNAIADIAAIYADPK